MANPPSSDPIPHKEGATYLPTVTAYDRWASTYDSDSNPLQALDDLELRTLLPAFVRSAIEAHATSTSKIGGEERSLHVVDLGCGTGRNTEKLVRLFGRGIGGGAGDGKGANGERRVKEGRITGLDASEGMLRRARERCSGALDDLEAGAFDHHHSVALNFCPFAIPTSPASQSRSSVSDLALPRADAILSTLTLEHVPLAPFFETAAQLLKPSGMLLLTNMHPDMGAVSQAGFTDAQTGEKVRPVSYAHGVKEVVEEAERWGFGVVEILREGEAVGEGEAPVKGVRESIVTRELVDSGTLGMRAEKWIGVRCWFGMVLRLNGDPGEEGRGIERPRVA